VGPSGMGIVLRRVRAGYVPGPPSVELRILSRTGPIPAWGRMPSAREAWRTDPTTGLALTPLTAEFRSIQDSAPREISFPSILTCARPTYRISILPPTAVGQQDSSATWLCRFGRHQTVPVPGYQSAPIRRRSRLRILACVPTRRTAITAPPLWCATHGCSQFLLPQPGEIVGQLQLPFAASQLAHQRLARVDFDR